MGVIRGFTLGIITGALLLGCVGFSYRYYGLDLVSYQGKLLADKPENDLDAIVCAPTSQSKSPCVIMLTRDFLAFKQDYLETVQRLKECQAPK